MRIPLSLVLALVLALPLAGCGGGGSDLVGGGGGPELPPILTVTNLDNNGPGSLRRTIDDAPPGAWIVFSTELATGDVTLESPLIIDKAVIIGGLSATFERFTIRGQAGVRLFSVWPGGSLDLRNLILRDGDTAHAGGGIYSEQGQLLLTNVMITGCHADFAGGAIYARESTVLIFACAFTANTTNDHGGALRIALSSQALVRDSSFFLNQAGVGGGNQGYGGAISVAEASADFVNVTIENNMADHGGAISGGTQENGEAYVGIWNATITNNESVVGESGGVRLSPANGGTLTAEIHRSVLTENHQFGGALGDLTTGLLGTGVVNPNVSFSLIHTEDVPFVNNAVNGNQTGVDANLGTVEAGPAGRIYRRPGAASPLLDAVPASTCVGPNGQPIEFDQRGEARDFLAPTDIGAVER